MAHIVKFGKPAHLCRGCGVMENVLGEFDVEVISIDIMKNPEVVDEYDLTGVPTILLVENGKEVKRHIGTMTEEEMEQWLK